MQKFHITSDSFFTKKRTDKFTARKKVLKSRKSKSIIANKRSTSLFGGSSRIIAMMAENYVGTSNLGNGNKRKLKIITPTIFSIIDNPVETIGFIIDLAGQVKRVGRTLNKIHFDQSNLKKFDLAANALLDIIPVELEEERKKRKAKKLNPSGVLPKDKALARQIRGVGIIKHLAVKHEAPKPDDAEKLEIFDVRSRNYEILSSTNADKKSKTCAKFVDHINKCLLHTKRELSDEGKINLLNYVGEIISNAEDHSNFKDWTIQGYLDNSLTTPMCEIAIFNFGKSIAESIRSIDPTSSTWKNNIYPYLEAHKQNRFFEPAWREEDLLTVIALQAHVSCKPPTATSTRGQGTVDLINFFQKVHAECCAASLDKSDARMAIVSGGTYILFDGKYKMRSMQKDHGMTVAFNEKNSLMEKPDSRYVRPLGVWRFPGTIISIRFPLSLTNRSMLEEVDNGSAQNDH